MYYGTCLATLFVLTVGCSTFPIGKPMTVVSLPYSEFAFKVAPPPSDADVASCMEASKPPARRLGIPYDLGWAITQADDVRCAYRFKDCLADRGYAVERADEPDWKR